MYEKDFEGWHRHKKHIDAQENPPTFKEREIWWCSVGVNVGYEIDGKNEFFNRPVLVFRKFSKRLFWGIPLSSKIKSNPHYYNFKLNNKDQSANLTHLRLYDSKRLTHHMGKLPTRQFKHIQEEIIKKVLRQ